VRLLLPALVALAGCQALTPRAERAVSFGATNAGLLHGGRPLSDRGPGYVRARPGEGTRHGTPGLVAALERAVAAVDAAFPGTAPARIGDLSSARGGRHPRHGSHRTGRDVDVLFYVTDRLGRSVPGRGWLAFNRFGFAVDEREDGGSGELFFFDDARNWHFVRTLLLDDTVGVQWLFVSRGVKARLLRHGAAVETDPRALRRAAVVLHQPRRAAPHDDHFHLRVLCAPADLPRGCRNRAPLWPWLEATWGAPPGRGPSMSDEALVELVAAPID
jgi:penicillin-insensitive murein endopeptidase